MPVLIGANTRNQKTGQTMMSPLFILSSDAKKFKKLAENCYAKRMPAAQHPTSGSIGHEEHDPECHRLVDLFKCLPSVILGRQLYSLNYNHICQRVADSSEPRPAPHSMPTLLRDQPKPNLWHRLPLLSHVHYPPCLCRPLHSRIRLATISDKLQISQLPLARPLLALDAAIESQTASQYYVLQEAAKKDQGIQIMAKQSDSFAFDFYVTILIARDQVESWDGYSNDLLKLSEDILYRINKRQIKTGIYNEALIEEMLHNFSPEFNTRKLELDNLGSITRKTCLAATKIFELSVTKNFQ